MIKQYEIGLFIDNHKVDAIYTIFSDGAGSLEVIGGQEGDYENIILSIPTALPVDSFYNLVFQFEEIRGELKINCKSIKLYAPYLPYGRADRAFSEGMCDIRGMFLNIMGMVFDEIITHDVHSETQDLRITDTPMNLKTNPPYEWKGLMNLLKSDFVVCAPDKGAYQRAVNQAEVFGKDIITCTKQRNTSNGWITGYAVDNPELVKGNHILIIDDICDGGKTFEICAKSLKDLGAKSVSLHVSHGIFSKGLDNFTGLLDHISCEYIVADYITEQHLHDFNKLNGGLL